MNQNPSPSAREQQYLDDIIEAVKNELCLIPSSEHTSPEQISSKADWKTLNVDSLDLLELAYRCENKFSISIPDDDCATLENIEQLSQYILSKLN